jgi:molybdenum cofactor cytidylyltransferase
MAEPAGLTGALTERLGVGPRELVAFVGAGGKTTLLLALGEELGAAASRLVLTTTTRMSADETPPWAATCLTLDEVRAVLLAGRPAFLISSVAGAKLNGALAVEVDEVFTDLPADHVLVEADGARKRSLKAPARHEPVIPAESTIVVVVAGLDSVGNRIADVAHRPHLVAALLGGTVDDVLRPQDVATVLSHPRGGLARIPESARVVVALTKANGDSALEIERQLASHARIERVVAIP